MINKIKTLILSLGAVIALSVPVALPVSVFAATPTPDIKNNLCSGASTLQVTDPNNNASKADCSTTAPGVTGFNKLLTEIINVISVLVGVIAVIMIIFAGFRYITSGGASDKVTGAKNTILYALIGLVIVALAQLIVKFVLNKATGV